MENRSPQQIDSHQQSLYEDLFNQTLSEGLSGGRVSGCITFDYEGNNATDLGPPGFARHVYGRENPPTKKGTVFFVDHRQNNETFEAQHAFIIPRKTAYETVKEGIMIDSQRRSNFSTALSSIGVFRSLLRLMGSEEQYKEDNPLLIELMKVLSNDGNIVYINNITLPGIIHPFIEKRGTKPARFGFVIYEFSPQSIPFVLSTFLISSPTHLRGFKCRQLPFLRYFVPDKDETEENFYNTRTHQYDDGTYLVIYAPTIESHRSISYPILFSEDCPSLVGSLETRGTVARNGTDAGKLDYLLYNTVNRCPSSGNAVKESEVTFWEEFGRNVCRAEEDRTFPIPPWDVGLVPGKHGEHVFVVIFKDNELRRGWIGNDHTDAEYKVVVNFLYDNARKQQTTLQEITYLD